MINELERSLRKYKNEFAIRFAQLMSVQAKTWKDIQKKEQRSLYSIENIMWYFMISLLGYIPIVGKPYIFEEHLFGQVFFFICAVCNNIRKTNKRYQDKIKSLLFSKLINVFGDEVYYIDGEGVGADEQNLKSDLGMPKSRIEDYLFMDSMLYADKRIDYRTDDDRIFGRYNNVDFVINETYFGWYRNEHDSKTYHCLFKGAAMLFTLNKTIKNRVIITTRSVYNKIPREYEKVELEYNVFAKKYDVYVDNNNEFEGQVEARYLLTTAFLDRFMNLHTSFNVSNIQCSVYDNKILIMLETSKDLFEMNHLFGRIDDIKQYDRLFDEFASVLSFIDVLNLSSKTKL